MAANALLPYAVRQPPYHPMKAPPNTSPKKQISSNNRRESWQLLSICRVQPQLMTTSPNTIFPKQITSNILLTLLVSFCLTAALLGAPTSENNARLKQGLKEHPEADTDKDGVLTRTEAKAYMAKRGMQKGRGGRGGRATGPTTVSAEDVPKGEEIKGIYGLYMGHSFFKPAAAGLLEIIPDTTVVNHTGCTVMSGGENGSPKLLWENSRAQAAGKKFLDSGKIELLVMTCFSEKDSSAEHYSQWFDYALEQNPKTSFMIATPWAKHLYRASVEELDEKEKSCEKFYERVIQPLRKRYPKNKILFCPYGIGVYELIKRFQKGQLQGVKYLLNPDKKARDKSKENNEQLFNDELGHGGELISHLNSLVWLQTIYDCDISTLKKQRVEGLPDVDLNEIAAETYKKVIPYNTVYRGK